MSRPDLHEFPAHTPSFLAGSGGGRSALLRTVAQLCGQDDGDFRRRWLEDYVLSDSVLGHAVPSLVREFAPAYPKVC